ncbi:MAG: hypothetical protein ABJB05_01145 [Parafilimonas sp.]
MKYFLLILFISFAFTASAQFIFIPKKPVKTLKETIEKYEGIELKDSIPFSFIRVIDSRYDTTIIGFHWDSYLTLQDSSSQPVALQHVIDKYYHSLYTPGKDTLIIQLERLSIQEAVIRDTNFILTEGNVSCKEYFGNNNKYTYYRAVDTVMKEGFSYKTTYSAHKNGKHMNFEFWDYYLLRLCEAMIKDDDEKKRLVNDSAEYFTVEQITQTGLEKRNKPVLTSAKLNSGFYNNFSEFVNNSPGFTYDSANALPKLLDVMHYRTGKHISNEMPDTSYWGYCDGKNLYVRYGYNFYQLERKDANFYIASTLDGRRKDLNSAGWNMLIGLAALSAGIAGKDDVNFKGFAVIPEPIIPMIVLPLNNVYILGLQLDWDTGSITF